MQKILITSLFLYVLFSCRQHSVTNSGKDILTFKVLIYPSFDETGKIILSKIDTQQQLKFIILDKEMRNKPIDTFYSKAISLSVEQFKKFDSAVIQKTRIKQTPQHEGCCDGINFQFVLTNNSDTTMLHFGNLEIASDTTGFRIIKTTLDNLAILYNDSVITDYITDIKSYFDSSVKPIHFKENRAINRLRKIEYSR